MQYKYITSQKVLVYKLAKSFIKKKLTCSLNEVAKNENVKFQHIPYITYPLHIPYPVSSLYLWSVRTSHENC